MLTPPPVKSPSSNVQQSTDTPASRVEWHLACMQAKALGIPLPPPPWETPLESTPTHRGKVAESLKELRVPARRERLSSKSPEIKERRHPLPKAQESATSKRTAPTAKMSPKVTRPLAASEPQSENIFAAATLPPRPPARAIPTAPKVAYVAMVEEKLPLISSLLLRAGVPTELILRDNRAQAVIDYFGTYLRAPVAQTLYRYDFGRQFVTRGDVPTANRAADIVLPLLLAETKRDLAVRFAQAETDIQREILSLNLPK